VNFDFELNANLSRLTISTNSQDLDAIVEAVNEAIRVELEAQAVVAGTDHSIEARFSKADLFNHYNYRRIVVRKGWYQHTFVLKDLPKVKTSGIPC
jgi:hypothetical protein